MFYRVHLQFTVKNLLNPSRVSVGFIGSMDQRLIMRFRHPKGLSATRIHHKLEGALGPDAMPYSTVTRILQSVIWIPTDSEIPHSEIDNAIVQALGGVPFVLVNKLARNLCCAPTTVHRYVTELLHFVAIHSQWVTHDETAT
jgi:hypothetical protein